MPNEELLSYIRTELARGVAHDDLARALLGVGWKAPIVDEAFEIIGSVESARSAEPEPILEPESSSVIPVSATSYQPDPTRFAAPPARAAPITPPKRSFSHGVLWYAAGAVLIVLVIGSIYIAYAPTRPAPAAPAASNPADVAVATTTTTTRPAPAAGPALSSVPYANTAYGYNLTTPAGWATSGSATSSTASFTIPSPPTATTSAATSAMKVAIWVSAPASGTAAQTELDAYMQAKITKLKHDLASFEFLSDATTTIGSAPARVILVSWKDGMTGVPTQMFELDAVRNSRVYEVSAIAPASAWNTYGPLYQAVLGSLTFTN
ncbi:MAG TPA: hypothetical protein VMV50_02110 [Candidatus Paceibacterota bacterium]|nr:hypothetical protein [Candidatus Paceibacterota bacterium]